MGNGTQLGAVRGLGSSKHGAEHWIVQRTTAIANFALMLWLIVSIIRLPDYDHETLFNWLRSPLAGVPMALLILSVITHMKSGLQVFIEDYVHDEGLKFGSLTALTFATYGLGATAFFALGRIVFMGAAS
jgi:succinate dehydrogenase / fumarate reductase, membrane anchor subunit